MTAPIAPPLAEIHVWHADLDDGGWPGAEDLPAAERRRAERLVAPRRRRWVAARWALRHSLAGYLGAPAGAIELAAGPHGKPVLADPAEPLRFNLSHSHGLALVAVATGREVGIDVERVGARPRAFYEGWVRREALGKCLGVGLAAPPPRRPVQVTPLDAGDGWAAALATGGAERLPLRRRRLRPAARAALARR